MEIGYLKGSCIMLESAPALRRNYFEIGGCKGLNSRVDEELSIVGGFDEHSWLPSFSSYSPSKDLVNSLFSMTTARSYASAAKLNGEIFVFGGSYGGVLYDTVESYSPTDGRNMQQASLNRGKRSSAGAVLFENFFASGGGDGTKCLSEVEELDLYAGRWVLINPMLERRFSPGAVDMNGTLYVAGGFDGKDYLRSVERFDPRERLWTHLGSMSARNMLGAGMMELQWWPLLRALHGIMALGIHFSLTLCLILLHLRIKIPYPFQWGTPIFRASHVFGMMGAALVSSAESTGTFYAAARLAGATSPPSHVISRSIGLQGIGQLLEGIFGSIVGTTASVENVGLLGLTRVGSRRVVQISTAFMIFFSIFGKFGTFFASIPLPIFAAIYCILYGFVAAVGISFIQFANSNSMRNIYVLGVSLFLGISIPQYFVLYTDMSGHGPVRTNAGWVGVATLSLFLHISIDNTLQFGMK